MVRDLARWLAGDDDDDDDALIGREQKDECVISRGSPRFMAIERIGLAH